MKEAEGQPHGLQGERSTPRARGALPFGLIAEFDG